MLATRFKIWAWGGPVGAGAMQSKHVGVAGVAKRATPQLPHAVASELLCACLARALFLPVPPSFIIEDDAHTPYHVSLNFALAGENLPPADPVAVVASHPGLACGIVLFDAWVGNGDRHNGNLAYDQATNRVMLFDHSHAFLASQDPAGWLAANNAGLGIGGHCLAPHIVDPGPFRDWASRIAQIPEFFIRTAVNECVTVGLPEAFAEQCAVHLLTRRSQLLQLVKASPQVFPSVAPAALAAL